jgi:alkaline phosphatase D
MPAFVRDLRAADAPYTDSELFPLGVFSGDPNAHSVVIGTRIAPEPLTGGGLRRPVLVRWEVATDPGMRHTLRAGLALALPQRGHSVQVVVYGLPADRWFWYRFSALGERSRVGRTRTFPRAGDECGALRFALASCQDYRAGLYGSYRDMLDQQLDFVLHVGDYLYEDGSEPSDLRSHVPGSGPNGEILTVDDYRNRYAQYRLDEDLRNAHAQLPFLVTWDDHELDNNYAAEIAEIGSAVEGDAFLARRDAAYRVYSEVMPLRPANRPQSRSRRLQRRLRFGRLADLYILDTRRYRSDQPCGDGFTANCGEEANPAATLLGVEQEQDLFRALARSPATWNALAQQIMVTRWDISGFTGAPVPVVNMDAWDGYTAARQRLTDFLATARPSNPVVLTGDIHSHFAADVLQNFDDRSSVVAAEIVGSSISSTFVGAPAARRALKQATLQANPHIWFQEGALRGYVLCDVSRDEWVATFKGVVDSADPASAVIDVAQARIQSGTPGFAGAPTVLADPDAVPVPAPLPF